MSDEKPDRRLADRKRTPGPEPDPRAEEAYLAWAMTAHKGRGAMPALARETGIGVDKLRYWKLHYGWEQRWVDDIQGARSRMIAEGEAVLLTALRPAMERLGNIALHGSDKDAVAAVKVFAAILGIDQSKGDRHLHLHGVDPRLIEEAREQSTGEMKRVLAAIGQDNIDHARIIKRRQG